MFPSQLESCSLRWKNRTSLSDGGFNSVVENYNPALLYGTAAPQTFTTSLADALA